MPQTKKGNQWHFGMKAHLGTDRASGLVHTVVATAQPLHGRETQVYADAGYVGVEKRGEIRAKDPAGRIGWQLARKRGPIKALENAKAKVRAFVEHPFHIVKNLFRHRKTRYRGLARNGHQLHTLFGLANVVIGGRTMATA